MPDNTTKRGRGRPADSTAQKRIKFTTKINEELIAKLKKQSDVPINQIIELALEQYLKTGTAVKKYDMFYDFIRDDQLKDIKTKQDFYTFFYRYLSSSKYSDLKNTISDACSLHNANIDYPKLAEILVYAYTSYNYNERKLVLHAYDKLKKARYLIDEVSSLSFYTDQFQGIDKIKENINKIEALTPKFTKKRKAGRQIRHDYLDYEASLITNVFLAIVPNKKTKPAYNAQKKLYNIYFDATLEITKNLLASFSIKPNTTSGKGMASSFMKTIKKDPSMYRDFLFAAGKYESHYLQLIQ